MLVCCVYLLFDFCSSLMCPLLLHLALFLHLSPHFSSFSSTIHDSTFLLILMHGLEVRPTGLYVETSKHVMQKEIVVVEKKLKR